MSDKNTDSVSGTPEEVGTLAAPVINWDDSEMRSVYANVVNAASTREEVTVFFGSNQTWNPGAGKEFDVKLLERIILSPYAAKRLFVLLGAVLSRYEQRFGEIKLEGIQAAADALKAQQAKSGNGPTA